MPDDSSRPDFTLRIAQHRAMSDAYRTRAEATHDELLRKVYSDMAATYENMARVIERTILRIESLELTTARAREKIAAAEPDRKQDPSAAAQGMIPKSGIPVFGKRSCPIEQRTTSQIQQR